jgi:hypothetical protein
LNSRVNVAPQPEIGHSHVASCVLLLVLALTTPAFATFALDTGAKLLEAGDLVLSPRTRDEPAIGILAFEGPFESRAAEDCLDEERTAGD